MLSIKNFSIAKLENKKSIYLLKDISLTIRRGTINILLGSNGSGKTTLLKGLFNYPGFKYSGSIKIDGNEIINKPTEFISQKSLFLSHQNPIEISGLSYLEFLKASYNSTHPKSYTDIWEISELFKKYSDLLSLKIKSEKRFVNEGFSGGEKKKSEFIQFLINNPKYALFDEIDSGLDISSTEKIYRLIKEHIKKMNTGILLVTHNSNILKYLKPDNVYLLENKTITKKGGLDLAKELLKTRQK